MPETHSTVIPVPDPTERTTLQLTRFVDDLKALVFIRLDAMDKAMHLFNENITRVPTDVDKQVGRLKELIEARLDTVNEQFVSADLKFLGRVSTVDERFDGIATQFHERDTRVDQTARASKEALDAALQAAKEAVGKQNDSFVTSIAKSESATAKQLDQLILLQNASASATNDKIEDLKNRVSAIESAVVTRRDVGIDHHTTSTGNAQIVGIAAATILGLLSLAVGLFAVFHTVAK